MAARHKQATSGNFPNFSPRPQIRGPPRTNLGPGRGVYPARPPHCAQKNPLAVGRQRAPCFLS